MKNEIISFISFSLTASWISRLFSAAYSLLILIWFLLYTLSAFFMIVSSSSLPCALMKTLWASLSFSCLYIINFCIKIA